MELIILWTCLAFSLAVTAFLAREDWFHLSRPAQRVLARVVGHRRHLDEGSPSFAALLEFSAEDGRLVRVEDKLYSALPKPAIGSTVTLHHPEGMPQRARIRRPVLRALIYLFLLYLNLVLIGRLMGWLSAGGGISGL
jgi:hypothetical protein